MDDGAYTQSLWPGVPGEMAARVARFDWAATPLGPIEHWSEGLRAIVGLVLSSPVVATLALLEGRLLIYNDAAARLYGDRHPSALGRPLSASFPDSYPEVAAIYDRVFAGETVTVHAQPLAVGTGPRDEVFDAYLSPVRTRAGAVIGVHMIGFEVGARLRDEQRLRDSEERFRAFVTASADVVYRMSPDWTEMRELSGQGFLADTPKPNEAWMDDYIRPGDQTIVRAAIAHAIATKSMFELEHRVRRADGALGWTLSRAIPILDEHGRVREWLGAATDVTEAKASEAELKAAEQRQRALLERQRLLLHELQHRVRNMLAVVRAMIAGTKVTSHSVEDFSSHLDGRLSALARTQMVMMSSPGQGVDLETMVREELLAQAAEEERIDVSGPTVELSPKAAEVLTLAMHELATNAVKYGALSASTGRLEIGWSTEVRGGQAWLRLEWVETGVGVAAAAPRRKGFGTELIELRVPYELRGHGAVHFRPGGIRCEIEFPLVAGASILQTDAPMQGTIAEGEA